MIKFYRTSFTIFYKSNILMEDKHPAISCFLSKKREIKKKQMKLNFINFELVGALSKFRVFFLKLSNFRFYSICLHDFNLSCFSFFFELGIIIFGSN